MEQKENKNKEETEELCCADKNSCSIDCAPYKENNSESECDCGSCC